MKHASWIAAIALTACGGAERPQDAPVVHAEPVLAAEAGEDSTVVMTTDDDSSECARLIQRINDAQSPLKDASGSDPAALRALAELLDQVALSIGAVAVSDVELLRLRDAYTLMARDLASASRDTASALEANDPQKAKELARVMSTFGEREREVVDAINAQCTPDAAPDAEVASPDPPAKGPFPLSTHPALRQPRAAAARAPQTFSAEFDTTAGAFVVSCTRSWAPSGVDRFYNLVSIGFFDGIGLFRAVEGFVVQFGIHGDPEVSKAWSGANIPADVVHGSNTEGALTFAQAGSAAQPNTTTDNRTTQLFVNLGDNTRLDGMGFAPVCRVSQGMDAVKAIYTGYGERAGADQAQITSRGNDYLRETYPRLDYIKTARLLP